MSMRLVLLGGAPGIGKSAAVRQVLHVAIGGDTLIQWVDVDALWAHQPWRVDETMITMVRANLRAVITNAVAARIDILIVTWVFQDSSLHDLVRGFAPAGTDVTTVQLRAGETRWRSRFEADGDRPDIDDFYLDRYSAAQSTPADHHIDTDDLDARGTARAVLTAIGLPSE